MSSNILDTLESPLDCQEIKPVNPKGNQPWIFIGRTDAEAPILWPPDAQSQLTGKDPDAGKDWGQEKRAEEGEMVGWYHWLNRHEFEQTLRDTEGQGKLSCYSPWGHKESDTTQRQNNNNNTICKHFWSASSMPSLCRVRKTDDSDSFCPEGAPSKQWQNMGGKYGASIQNPLGEDDTWVLNNE